MIALETGRCTQGCKMPYLSIVYDKGEHRFGLLLRGCGGPYVAEQQIPGSALRSLSEAQAHDLPIKSARLLADLQREVQQGIARLVREKMIDLADGERFLDEVFP